jgi:hypothetical protein
VTTVRSVCDINHIGKTEMLDGAGERSLRASARDGAAAGTAAHLHEQGGDPHVVGATAPDHWSEGRLSRLTKAPCATWL